MKINYLTLEDVVAIHRRIISRVGGRPEIRDIGLLHAVCEKSKTILAGEEVYSSLSMKAAVFLEAMINYHPFIDGNKRTAFIATDFFLIKNGARLLVSPQDGMKCMLAVANKKLTLREIEKWIASHLDPKI